MCRHKSNEPNPIGRSHPQGFDGPCWPFPGTAEDPHGKRCLLCPWAFKLAGYANMSMKDFSNKLRGNFEESASFLACVKMLVVMIEDGSAKAGMRLRGSTVDAVHSRFSEVQKRS